MRGCGDAVGGGGRARGVGIRFGCPRLLVPGAVKVLVDRDPTTLGPGDLHFGTFLAERANEGLGNIAWETPGLLFRPW